LASYTKNQIKRYDHALSTDSTAIVEQLKEYLSYREAELYPVPPEVVSTAEIETSGNSSHF
jgi:hypothetical protein